MQATTTPAFWIDFLNCEYELAKGTEERVWQAVPHSLSKAEYDAVFAACEFLNFDCKGARTLGRLSVTLRRRNAVKSPASKRPITNSILSQD